MLNVRSLRHYPNTEHDMEPTIGTLEDVGGSVLICDHCETMFSKLDRRYHDGDECPTCRDGQAAPDVIAAANRYGRV